LSFFKSQHQIFTMVYSLLVFLNYESRDFQYTAYGRNSKFATLHLRKKKKNTSTKKILSFPHPQLLSSSAPRPTEIERSPKNPHFFLCSPPRQRALPEPSKLGCSAPAPLGSTPAVLARPLHAHSCGGRPYVLACTPRSLRQPASAA
jgi:hypothetical protein